MVWPSGADLLTDLLGDDAGALGVVLDHERLAEPLGEFLAQQPADDVGTAAGRGADDDAHRPRRPCLSIAPDTSRRGRERAGGLQQRSSRDTRIALSRLDPGRRDHAAPGLDLALDMGAIRLRRGWRRDVAGLGELGDDVGQLQRPMHFGIEPIDDRARRPRRHDRPSQDMNSMPGTLSATVGASGISG